MATITANKDRQIKSLQTQLKREKHATGQLADALAVEQRKNREWDKLVGDYKKRIESLVAGHNTACEEKFAWMKKAEEKDKLIDIAAKEIHGVKYRAQESAATAMEERAKVKALRRTIKDMTKVIARN